MPTTYSQPYNVLNVNCPSRRVLNLLADKWTMLVIIALDHGTRRHSQLMREIGGISQKMLTQTLRSLEQDGLVQRTVYPVVPPMVEYSLTPLGKTLTEPIQAIRTWAEQYLPEVEKARAGYVHAMQDAQERTG